MLIINHFNYLITCIKWHRLSEMMVVPLSMSGYKHDIKYVCKVKSTVKITHHVTCIA